MLIYIQQTLAMRSTSKHSKHFEMSHTLMEQVVITMCWRCETNSGEFNVDRKVECARYQQLKYKIPSAIYSRKLARRRSRKQKPVVHKVAEH